MFTGDRGMMTLQGWNWKGNMDAQASQALVFVDNQRRHPRRQIHVLLLNEAPKLPWRSSPFKFHHPTGWPWLSLGPRKVHQNAWSKNAQISQFLSEPSWPIFIRNWHHAFTKPKFYPNFGLLFNRPPNFGYFISIFNFHYFFVFPPLQASLCVLASLRQQFTTAEGR